MLLACSKICLACPKRSGEEVSLIGDAWQILHELATHERWQDVQIAYVSRTDEPSEYGSRGDGGEAGLMVPQQRAETKRCRCFCCWCGVSYPGQRLSFPCVAKGPSKLHAMLAALQQHPNKGSTAVHLPMHSSKPHASAAVQSGRHSACACWRWTTGSRCTIWHTTTR